MHHLVTVAKLDAYMNFRITQKFKFLKHFKTRLQRVAKSLEDLQYVVQSTMSSTNPKRPTHTKLVQ